MFVVVIRMLVSVPRSLAHQWEAYNGFARIFNWSIEGVRLVVRLASKVACHVHWSVSLVVGDSGSVWTVDGDVVEVSSKSVSVSIWVGEESALEHFVIGEFNTWYSVCRGKGCLLNFSKIVVWISVENHFSNWNEGVVFLRDCLCDI